MHRLLLALLAVSGLMLSSASAEKLDRRIVVVNDTGIAIVGLYASPIDQRDWKYNMLQGDTLYAHSNVVADIDDGTGYCRYDLLAVFRTGATVTHMNANVCEKETWTIVP